MLKLKIYLVLIMITIAGLSAQQTKSTAVTIYNSGSGVVNEVREIKLKKGMQEYSISDLPEKLNPATVKINLKNARILEQNFKYDLVNSTKILNKYIGKEITLIGKTTITGKLLSASYNNMVIQKSDGGLTIITKIDDYQISVGSLPEGFVLNPTLLWKIQSESENTQDADLIYQTDGMQWKAEYVGILNENDTKLDINAWINLDNASGKTYTDAKLKLIAGDINRVTDNNGGVLYAARDKASTFGYADTELATEQSFFEYHLYTIENPTTIANNEQKQIMFFDKTSIPCTKIFKLSTDLGEFKDLNPGVFVKFKNSKENNMGIPIPKGIVRMFKNSGKSKELVGEASIKHTPKDEDVEMEIGKAFDVVVTEKEINTQKISDKITETEYEAEFRNRKNEDIVIEYAKFHWSSLELIKSSINPKEKLAREVKFDVPVKKESTFKMTYKVRTQN